MADSSDEFWLLVSSQATSISLIHPPPVLLHLCRATAWRSTTPSAVRCLQTRAVGSGRYCFDGARSEDRDELEETDRSRQPIDRFNGAQSKDRCERCEDQAGIEDTGRTLRSAAVAACRFTLRDDRAVQGVLDRIVRGDGIADLVQDLDDLAVLVEQNLAALAPNRKFDAPRQVPTLRDTAREIRLGLAQYRTADAQKTAVDLRNRAWTWLDLHVTQLREAGRYAFLGSETAKEFRSAYERRSRLSRRRASTDTAEPTTTGFDTSLPTASPEIDN